jgi:fermentation-respiration switch protein FrsA (DUF1100 family)
MMAWLTVALVFLILAVVFEGFLFLGALAIAYLSTHPPRRSPRRTPEHFGAGYEEVAFPAGDGTPLTGWLIQAENPRAVLLLTHGMLANRADMLPWAQWLWEAGYSLLMFDFRGSGQSGGDLCTMGLHEPEDVRGALDFLETRPETAGLSAGILGFSMGGTVAILAAASDSRLQAVVTHGAYATLDRVIRQRCIRHFGPLAPLVEWQTRRIGRRWFPAESIQAVSCLEVVRRIAPRPLLLLNGARDLIVPPDNAHDLHDAAHAPKDLCILPHTAHPYPSRRDEPDYRRRVLAFFERAFAGV